MLSESRNYCLKMRTSCFLVWVGFVCLGVLGFFLWVFFLVFGFFSVTSTILLMMYSGFQCSESFLMPQVLKLACLF